jgi:hypothetical protein
VYPAEWVCDSIWGGKIKIFLKRKPERKKEGEKGGAGFS